MAKLTKEEVTRLQNVGITDVTTQEEAKKIVVKYLASKEVHNVEDETLSELLNMVEAFYDPKEDDLSEVGEGLELSEESSEDLEEELEEEPEPQPDDEDLLEGLKKEVKTQPKKQAVVVKGQRPAAQAPKPQPAVAKKPAVVPPTVKKTSSKQVRGEYVVGAELFDGRNNEADLEYLQPFIDRLFESDDYDIAILKNGFTVRLMQQHSALTIMNFDGLRKDEANMSLIGDFYANRLSSPEELLSFLPERFHDHKIGMFRGESHPSIKKVTTEDVIEILENGLLEESLKRATKTDVRKGKNAQDLETKLSGKKSAAK